MYLDWSRRDTYAIDIETESLTPSILHCLCWENVKTGETGECLSLDSIRDFFEKTKGSYYVGHNILKFDAPVLVRITGVLLRIQSCIDTLVLGTLYSPNIAGGHSLEEWGLRLGIEKVGTGIEDFSRLTPELLARCHSDVKITTRLFIKLIRVLKKIEFSEKSIDIQHRWTIILDRQRRNGFYFNGQQATALYQTLRSKEESLEGEIRVVFPPERILRRTSRLYTKTGRPTAIYQTDSARYECVSDGDLYQAYESVDFSIGSPKQRIEKLVELGWVPEEFTPKTKTGGGGNPMPFQHGKMSPSLERFLEGTPTPEVELIGLWMSINGRANMIRTWLNEWNEDDGCIHGKLFIADTLRLRHQAPNTANIPAVRTNKQGDVLYGLDGHYTYEARDCWCARPGRVLVGTDAAGLELRMLAHYLNRPEFTAVILGGDPHQFNADTVGITRALAKTLLYAIQYGAQPKKVSSIIGSTLSEGKRVRQEFLDRLGLTEVMNDAIYEQGHGRVSLVDGSQVVCPSPHSALNYKFQGGGARVMALASIILESYIRRDGLDSLKVGDIHDEWQYDVLPSDSVRHAERSVQAIREAGEELNFNLPLDGTAKQGLTWAETH